MPATRGERWTAREVRQLIARAPLASPRYELVDGALLVTPSPEHTHQRAVVELLAALHGYLRSERIGRALTSPSDVELESESIVQPDVFVVPLEESVRLGSEGFPARALMLAVEILSPSSARYDRVAKLSLYQRHVDEYWIVDINARLVERWRSGDTRPEIVTTRLTWQPSSAATPLELDLAKFFEEISGP